MTSPNEIGTLIAVILKAVSKPQKHAKLFELG